ncbi:MAG: PAS domain S-box protein [Armatimonadota bacterium]
MSMTTPLQVLIVEESELEAQRLREELQRGGLQPVATQVATRDALHDALTRQRWDVILMADNLPQVSWQDALQLVRRQQGRVPFIVVAGESEEQVGAEIITAGAHDCIFRSDLIRLVPVIERELCEVELQRQFERSEADIRTREERFRLLVEQINDWVWEVDERIVYTYASPRIRDLLGYAPEEIVGKNPFDLMPPEEAERVRNEFTPIIARHEPFTLLDNTLVHRDGHLITVETSGFPIVDEQGVFHGYRGIDRDITARIQAERALAASEERYRYIVETAGEGIWALDIHEQTTYVNQQMAEMLGYTRDEMCGRLLGDFMDEEDYANAKACIARRAPGLVQHEEFRFRRKDGSYLWALVATTPIFDEHGLLVSTLGMLTDITERKHAEEALAQRSHQLEVLSEVSRQISSVLEIPIVIRTLVASAMELVDATAGASGVYTEGKMVFTEYNRNGQLIPVDLSFGPDEGVPGCVLVERAAYVSNDPEHDPHVKPSLRQAYGFYNLVDVPIIARDGKLLGCFELHNKRNHAPFTREDVSILEGLAANTAVTLENARLLQESRQTEAALERERAFLSSAIDLLPFPIFFVSPAGEIIRTNRAFQTLQGTMHQTYGPGFILLTPDTHIPIPRERWPGFDALKGKVPPTLEAVISFYDGRDMPVLVYSAPVYTDDKVVAAVIAVQDITALKEADRAKDQFLAVLSHELKTPLTSILGWTQAARTHPENIPRALEVIERNARRQGRILEDLLDVSRMVYGKMFIQTEPTDLWRLAEQSAESVMQEAKDRGLTLALEPPRKPLPIEADPPRILQAIGNLLANAMKFTPPGGRITVSGRRKGGMGAISVRDTGRGIPREELAGLFRTFHQVQRSEAAGGLGLGLALVKGIVELHGGHAEVASRGPGKGSTFMIALPLDEMPDTADSRNGGTPS